MRAITVHPQNPNSIELQEVGEPPEAEGALLVETLALGVCGTDREIIAGHYGEAPDGHARLILGHEFAWPRARSTGRLRSQCRRSCRRHRAPSRSRPLPGLRERQWDMCRNGLYTEHGIKGRERLRRGALPHPPEFAVKVDSALGARPCCSSRPASSPRRGIIADRVWRLEERTVAPPARHRRGADRPARRAPWRAALLRCACVRSQSRGPEAGAHARARRHVTIRASSTPWASSHPIS